MSVFYKKDSVFVKLDNEISKGSINDIGSYLGYTPEQTYTYFGDYDPNYPIQHVIFEIFTDNIIFISTLDSVDEIKEDILSFFLKNFKINEEYNSLFIQDTLLDGVLNKSFTIEFLSKVLDFYYTNDTGNYYSNKIDTHLDFINGILISFKVGNELNKWARHIKELNPGLIADYAHVSKLYWNDEIDMIIEEVNSQAESWADTPNGFENDFIDLHKNEFGLINFTMLLVCHLLYPTIFNRRRCMSVEKKANAKNGKVSA